MREQDENRFSGNRTGLVCQGEARYAYTEKVNHARINNITLLLQKIDVIDSNKYFNIQFNKLTGKIVVYHMYYFSSACNDSYEKKNKTEVLLKRLMKQELCQES